MKALAIILLFFSTVHYSYSQDIILKTNGDEISSKVIEVGIDIVKFKKYENLNGPIYTLSKQDIFMIKYENGTKDVFSNYSSSKSVAKHDKRKNKYEIKEELNNYLVEHDNKRVIYDYQFDIDKVIEASKIYYYGVDFSTFVLENPRKLGQENELDKYIGAWYAYFEKEIPPENYLKRWIRKEELILRQQSLQELNKDINRDWITYSAEGIPIEQVLELNKEHLSLISEDEGIGFVIIIDSFNKQNETVTGIYNFFDISTGELLWSAKAVGGAGGKGMTGHWGYGMISSLKCFVDRVYLDTIGR